MLQDKVNFYASELNIARMNREKQKDKNRHHLFAIEAYNTYDYHHNFFEGAVNRDMKFWEPELIRNYTKQIWKKKKSAGELLNVLLIVFWKLDTQ